MEYARARVKLPPELSKLSKSQFISAINEANLGVVDNIIAQRYYIDQIPQAYVADELGVTRLTVTRRISSITGRVAAASCQLPQ